MVSRHQERRIVKENRALKWSWTQSHIGLPVWWRLLGVSQGADQGLGPSHLHSCEQSLLAPVIPLTLLGARISPACGAWHPASCLALAALVELPELSLACLPKMISSSRAFLTDAKTWIRWVPLSHQTPLCMAFPWDGHIRASCRAGHALFQAILLQWREG